MRHAYEQTKRAEVSAGFNINDYLADLVSKAERGTISDVYDRIIDEVERKLFTLVIRSARGNQAMAARWLGITRTTLREKLIHFGLRPPQQEPV